MDIIGINRHHNASSCLVRQGEIVFHIEEERLTRHKRDSVAYKALVNALKYTREMKHLALSGMSAIPKAEVNLADMYTIIATKYQEKEFTWHDLGHLHHESHAACAFYNSGFDEAVCVIVDGCGSRVGDKEEMESVFLAQYPATFFPVLKRYYAPNMISVGWMFEAISKHFGFDRLDGGKVMGLSAYGKPNSNIPDMGDPYLYYKDSFIPKTYNETFQVRADLAKKLQEVTQKRVLDLILDAVEKTGVKNVCLSGGYALNCLANSFYLKHLPKDINLYIEPISSDAGTSIGAAKTLWHFFTNDCTKRKLESLYLGNFPAYSKYRHLHSEKDNVNYEEIVDILLDKKVVALFQGRSEAGPRSLGNRSILFDPRVKNGKDIVNTIKKREEFRPFAGTILEEDFEEWFDTLGLKSSPFMMYALEVKEEKRELIPSIVHVDGTCRIQTVNEKQNFHLYHLIREFKKRTGVPILFNTSLNLAGEPLCETLQDAISTFENSEIQFLFLPEKQKLIFKQ